MTQQIAFWRLLTDVRSSLGRVWNFIKGVIVANPKQQQQQAAPPQPPPRPPKPNAVINDAATDTGVGFLASLHAMSTLDSVVELAEALRIDVDRNRDQYRNLGPAGQAVRRFKQVEGGDPDWPDKAERRAGAESVFGPGEVLVAEGDGGQHEGRERFEALRSAARTYSERPQFWHDQIVIDRVKDAVRALREYLPRLFGAGLGIVASETMNIFNAAEGVLRDQELPRIFNALDITDANWPRCDPHGSDLVAKMAKGMPEGTLSPEAIRMLTRKFTVLQEIAQFGAAVIRGVMDDNWENDANLQWLISDAYRWHTALERYWS